MRRGEVRREDMSAATGCTASEESADLAVLAWTSMSCLQVEVGKVRWHCEPMHCIASAQSPEMQPQTVGAGCGDVSEVSAGPRCREVFASR